MKTGTVATHLIATALLVAGCNPTTSPKIPLPEMLNGGIINANGTMVSSEKLLETEFLLLYFSAHWCPPCRAFTPKLVQFYKNHEGGKHFNILFISSDQSAGDMQAYIREARMPWLAVKYRSPNANALADRYAGNGIPCLVLINNKGAVLADSYKGKRYLGPQNVLTQFERLLNAKYPQTIEIEPNTAPAPSSAPAPKQSVAEKLRKKYKINGFGKGSSGQLAIINGELKETGTELESGVIIFDITDGYVELFSKGERYRLYPEK